MSIFSNIESDRSKEKGGSNLFRITIYSDQSCQKDHYDDWTQKKKFLSKFKIGDYFHIESYEMKFVLITKKKRVIAIKNMLISLIFFLISSILSIIKKLSEWVYNLFSIYVKITTVFVAYKKKIQLGIFLNKYRNNKL